MIRLAALSSGIEPDPVPEDAAGAAGGGAANGGGGGGGGGAGVGGGGGGQLGGLAALAAGRPRVPKEGDVVPLRSGGYVACRLPVDRQLAQSGGRQGPGGGGGGGGVGGMSAAHGGMPMGGPPPMQSPALTSRAAYLVLQGEAMVLVEPGPANSATGIAR